MNCNVVDGAMSSRKRKVQYVDLTLDESDDDERAVCKRKRRAPSTAIESGG